MTLDEWKHTWLTSISKDASYVPTRRLVWWPWPQEGGVKVIGTNGVSHGGSGVRSIGVGWGGGVGSTNVCDGGVVGCTRIPSSLPIAP